MPHQVLLFQAMLSCLHSGEPLSWAGLPVALLTTPAKLGVNSGNGILGRIMMHITS